MAPRTAVPPEQDSRERQSPAAAAAGNALAAAAAAAAAAVAENDALLQANGGNADDAEPAIQNNVIISTALNTNFTRRQAETLRQSGAFPIFNEYSTSQVNLGLIYIMLNLGKQ